MCVTGSVTVIPLFKVAMAEKATRMVGDVFASGWVGQGPRVDEFEGQLHKRLRTRYLATVNSATSGLHLAIHMTAGPGHTPRPGEPPQGEVLTTALTCTATNWPILANGLRIRWVDVDPATLNVDLDDLAQKISPATRAIVVVHWAGYPLDLDRLRGVIDAAEAKYGFRPMVIEDCAHAWGSTYRGLPLGNHGNIAVYSFQAIKHLTTGDGGVVVFPTEELAERAKILRWYGIDRRRSESTRLAADIPEYGFKFHMNDINAAIGLANLPSVDARVARHQENAAYYDRELKDVPDIELTERASNRQSSCWLYTVLVGRRPEFEARMHERGIAVSQVHQRNDVYSVVRESRVPLPGLDRVADRMVCIPVGWWVDDADREYIAETIHDGW
jgi:dTDP-4-amino-4,6-dideoxy-D-glucose/dTDP-4-amino-2,4-dideoxy-beta-L-xylose transaminase